MARRHDRPRFDGLPLTPTRRAVAAGPLGVAVAVGVGLTEPWQTAPLLGWAVAALTWAIWTWLAVLRLDPAETKRFATREEPRGSTTALLLLTAAVASLAAVVLGILKAAHSSGNAKPLLLGAGIASILGSWAVVHTVFSLRYAFLYYADPAGGIDFHNDTDEPAYLDFAYVAFTIGMTYQVSDTDLTSRPIRHTALRHALLSYLIGTVIIAATINLAAGLVK